MRNIITTLTVTGSLLCFTAAFAADPGLTCQASKLKTVSKYDACRLKAYSKAVRGESVPEFGRCSLLRFADAEARANGLCTTTGDQSDIESFVDFCTDSVAVALAGGELPVDCLTCGEDLDACESDLSECQDDLASTNADLGTCNGNLSSCTSSLSTCNGNLSTCQSSLGTATSGTATVAQVLAGRTFTSSAGIGVTGTMPNNGSVSITPGATSQAIAAGYHNGAGSVAGDSDLVAGNIKNGINLFGVNGTVVAATGSATAAQVLSGVSFSNVSGSSTGTMPNNGAVSITPGTASQAIAAGYHNGSGSVAGDADLVAGNIKSGVELFGVVGTASAGGGGLPKTGQTTCYNSSGATISCSGSGQDGQFQKGIARSFTDNGDGTITDNVTGLMWEKQSDNGDIHDKDNTYTWDNAFASKVATLNSMVFAGHNDWRVPNVVELQSLLNYGAWGPSTFSAFNTSCAWSCTVLTCSCTGMAVEDDYWSSTTFDFSPSYTSYAWIVNFIDGFTHWGLVGDVTKTASLGVRAVRGGQ